MQCPHVAVFFVFEIRILQAVNVNTFHRYFPTHCSIPTFGGAIGFENFLTPTIINGHHIRFQSPGIGQKDFISTIVIGCKGIGNKDNRLKINDDIIAPTHPIPTLFIGFDSENLLIIVLSVIEIIRRWCRIVLIQLKPTASWQ